MSDPASLCAARGSCNKLTVEAAAATLLPLLACWAWLLPHAGTCIQNARCGPGAQLWPSAGRREVIDELGIVMRGFSRPGAALAGWQGVSVLCGGLTQVSPDTAASHTTSLAAIPHRSPAHVSADDQCGAGGQTS